MYCQIICGADSWVDVEMFGKAKKDWFSRLLELPNGRTQPLMLALPLQRTGNHMVRGCVRSTWTCIRMEE